MPNFSIKIHQIQFSAGAPLGKLTAAPQTFLFLIKLIPPQVGISWIWGKGRERRKR